MTSPQLGYVILWCEDLEVAIRFYTHTLGFAEKVRHGDYVVVTATFDRAVAAGATPIQPPHEQPWGQLVSHLRDPDGHLLEICSPVA